MKIKIIVDTKEFTDVLNNETSTELMKITPMTLNMSELNK